MKVLWTLLKIVVVLALAVPLSIIVLATALGVLGALFGLAVFVLRIAVLGLLAWGAFSLLRMLFGGSKPAERPREIAAAPPVDRYYDEAMRELDRDVGTIR